MNGQDEKEKQTITDPQPKQEDQPTPEDQLTPDTDKKQEDDGKISRRELGSIIKKQLTEARQQWEEETAEKIEKAKQDGRDEAKMTAQQLAEKHAKEREEKLKARASELDKRFAELDHRDHVAHAKDLLSEKHLPTGIAEMVLGKTEEETKANIETFAGFVDQAVRNAIHRNSAQNEPQNGGAPDVSSKKFSDMTLDEQTELYRKDPDLYQKLSQQK